MSKCKRKNFHLLGNVNIRKRRKSPIFLRAVFSVALSRNKRVRGILYAPACYKCSPRGALQSLISAEASLTRKHDRHTDTHWCIQPDNSDAPHWSWISTNVFADVSTRVEVFFLLCHIFRQRQRQTYPSKQTHTCGGLISFWTGGFP